MYLFRGTRKGSINFLLRNEGAGTYTSHSSHLYMSINEKNIITLNVPQFILYELFLKKRIFNARYRQRAEISVSDQITRSSGGARNRRLSHLVINIQRLQWIVLYLHYSNFYGIVMVSSSGRPEG